MQEERDSVVFTDDEGNDFELEVLDYFFYNGQEFAVLTDAVEEDHQHGEDCDHEHDHDVYIMKVMQVGEDMEEFVPVEDDLMETLIQIVQTRFDEDFDEEDLEDEDEEEGEEEE